MKYGFSFLIALAIAVSSCGNDGSGRERDPKPVPPGNGRPDVTEVDDFSSELADGVLRYSGPSMTLRYDRGGVLVSRDDNGRYGIVDLDGAAEISFTYSGIGADSMLISPELMIGEYALRDASVKMMGRAENRIWLKIIDSDSAIHVMVLPERLKQ